jgi:hypothetical protein
MGFSNDILGGAAALIRAAIKSPNFVHNSTGWSINKDGSVEFNNGTFRGTISGGSLIVNNSFGAAILTINQSSSPGTWLLYLDTGSAVQGSLAAAGAGKAGTDQFGNPYPAGLSSWQGAFTGTDYTLNSAGFFMYGSAI